MPEILPIRFEKQRAAECTALGAEFLPDAMAYAAYEAGSPLVICQFTISEDKGTILAFNSDPKTENTLNYLTVRAVLAFMEICGAESCLCHDGILPPELYEKTGFSLSHDETYAFSFNIPNTDNKTEIPKPDGEE